MRRLLKDGDLYTPRTPAMLNSVELVIARYTMVADCLDESIGSVLLNVGCDGILSFHEVSFAGEGHQSIEGFQVAFCQKRPGYRHIVGWLGVFGPYELQPALTKHPQVMVCGKSSASTASCGEVIHFLGRTMARKGRNLVKLYHAGGWIECLGIIFG